MARKKKRERREERINLDTIEAKHRRNCLGNFFIDEMLKEESLGRLARGELGTRKEYKTIYVPVDFYEDEKKYL